MHTFLKWLLIAIPLILLMLVLRPVPQLSDENACSVTGKVIQILESGQKDVSIVLEGNGHHFYINRGLEGSLTLKALREDLMGRQATLVYPRHWTPLDPFDIGHHVSQIFLAEEMVYSE